jgi:glutathione S-transferase
LLLRHFELPFAEVGVPLDTPEYERRIGALSPTRRVPALHVGDEVVWDSLAICEVANERWLGDRGWPSEPRARAAARSAAAEMHSGFGALRARFGDPRGFLCGGFGIVDAMYAPVCVRFRGYGVPVDAVGRAFMDTIFALPAMREWQRGAETEVPAP